MGVLEDNLYDDKKSLTEVIIPEDWLLPEEVADLFGVNSRTVLRWNDKFENVRKFKTPGGHNRYYKPDVQSILEQNENDAKASGK